MGQPLGEAEEEIDLVLKDAVVYLTAFLDEKLLRRLGRRGVPGNRPGRLDGSDRFRGSPLGVRTATGLSLSLVPPGDRVVFKAQEHRTLKGKKWKAKDFQVFLVSGRRGQAPQRPLHREPGHALQLSAVFVDERHGGREIPMSGVQVLIYSGHVPTGKPFRQPVLADRAPKPRDRSTRASTRSFRSDRTFRGAPVEPEALNPVFVEGGETTEAIFRFRQARGRLTGFLLEQRSQDGFEGARVRLYPIDGGSWLSAETGEHGQFTFEDVPAGLHELVLEKASWRSPTAPSGSWRADSPRSRKVMVKAQATEIIVPPLQLVQDDHVLVIRVVGADASPSPASRSTSATNRATTSGPIPSTTTRGRSRSTCPGSATTR